MNGAAWASVACHLVAFAIAITSLVRHIKIDINLKKYIFKPAIATFIMGICSYFIYIKLNGIIAERMATIIAISVAVIIYLLAILALKIFTKEEITALPMGEKIYKILKKSKIY